MKDAQAKSVYLKDYRVPDFLVDEVHLYFELYDDRTIVTSTLSLRRNPASDDPQAPLVLNGRDLELIEITLDGETLSEAAYLRDEETLTMHDVPDAFTVNSQVRIYPQDNTSLEGLYQSRRMFCTQCEAEGFRKITFYPDRPDVLSRFTTTIEAERESCPVLLSNGNMTGSGDCDGPDKAGRHWTSWHDPFKKPCYLFALVAGDLRSVDDSFTTRSGRRVKLKIFVEGKDLDKCEFAMRSLKKAMKWDEEVYGREYDLDIFMIVAVDDFNMGAMENKGLNIFNSSCVLARPETSTDNAFQRIEAIVAHEYFHNWSGNRVTCRDWFQLSLKEGFTVYRDAEFSADMGSRAVKRIDDVNYLRTAQFAEDAGPMAHSVRPDSYMEISNFYTVTVYEKGAEVVRMIARLLGPEKFREGTDRYFEKFDGMAVTTEDFVATMEEVSGLDLSRFRCWYTQAGTPELHVSLSFDEKKQSCVLSVEQSCPPTPGQPVKENFHIPFTVGLLDKNGDEIPLRLEGEDAPPVTSKVLAVSEKQQRFVFTGIREKPVPSLLRGFSAPVKLRMDYTRDELVFLMRHDTDGFVRWESSQQLAMQIINELLAARRFGKALTLDPLLVDAMRSVLESALQNKKQDRAMLARLLVLPTETYIGESSAQIDVDGIHHVREFIRSELAVALEEPMAEVYTAMQDTGAYRVTADAIARRSLKNTVLLYLNRLETEQWTECCFEQYRQAANMTDRHAALKALLEGQSPLAEERRQRALAEFYRKWRAEPLVVEQWLAMQAAVVAKENLSKVIELTRHEAFDIRNPNKVRAVIASFCHQNLVGFHHESGSGYRFLADKVLELNGLNPQIAARLLSPLTQWRKYDSCRQTLMKEQLQRILAADKLSKDVYEVASKGLQH